MATPALDMPELAAVAEDVFLLHPFEEVLGLWQRVEIDGSGIGFDATFNHQLWFAAAGSLLTQPKDGLVSTRVERFVEALPQNMSLYESGLVRHALQGPLPGSGRRSLRGLIAGLIRRRKSSRPDQSAMRYRAMGYHAFNLYALALLATRYPGHPVWRSVMLRTALFFIDSEEYLTGIENNTYGFSYNPPGFEIAFTLHAFAMEFRHDVRPEMGAWVTRQMRRCYDFDSHQMSRDTEDPATHAARLYEATRLPDLALSLDESGLAPTQHS